MLALIFIGMAGLFDEISDIIGKVKITARIQNLYTFGFLNTLWGTVFLILLGVFHYQDFIFTFASLPTLLPRILFEILLAHISLIALSKADRSLYSIVRTGTIPLLLVVDLVIGYTVSLYQILGIVVILIGLLTMSLHKGISKSGFWWALSTSVLAGVTISLYKYDIAHYNSVAAEQSIVSLCLALYFYLSAVLRAKENPFTFLKEPAFLMQSVAVAISGVLFSFAYLFAAASVITAGKRAASVIYGFISGKYYFKEQKTNVRFIALIVTLGGLVLLAIA